MHARSAAALTAWIVLGCTDPVSTVGLLHVSVSTTGGDFDVDGYQWVLDDDAPRTIAIAGRAVLEDVKPGEYTVELRGLANNCSIVGTNPVAVKVVANNSVEARFEVLCTPTGVRVSTSTAGADGPSGYVISLDGTQSGTVPAIGTVRIGRLAPGMHSVELRGAGQNCVVTDQNPRSVTLVEGKTIDLSFAVTCVAITASIEVSVVTTGPDLDRDGYLVLADGRLSGALPTGGSFVVDGVSAGDHAVTIGDVADHCQILGEPRRTVGVVTGGLTRDTARVAFDVACDQIWSLAFSRLVPGGDYGDGTAVYMARADGTDPTLLGWGDDPDWSAGGSRVVFSRCEEWSYYYYGVICHPTGLAVVDMQNGVLDQITTVPSDGDAAWRPDGGKIAIRRGTSLQLMVPDTWMVSPLTLPAEVRAAGDPSWSPDGMILAFTCEIEPANQDVCTVGADGSGFARLTADAGADSKPAWSPVGTWIAFETSRFGVASQIALMSPDGTGFQRLQTAMHASSPAWSTDGAAIVFSGADCDAFGRCSGSGLFSMNADGSNVTRLTDRADRAPAWRR